jgi:hypothetical protein
MPTYLQSTSVASAESTGQHDATVTVEISKVFTIFNAEIKRTFSVAEAEPPLGPE